jgi:hypothetical protein
LIHVKVSLKEEDLRKMLQQEREVARYRELQKEGEREMERQAEVVWIFLAFF